MSDFKTRLETEQSELGEKIEKLSTFIDNDKFKSVAENQQGLLKRQLQVMKDYKAILDERISLL